MQNNLKYVIPISLVNNFAEKNCLHVDFLNKLLNLNTNKCSYNL